MVIFSGPDSEVFGVGGFLLPIPAFRGAICLIDCGMLASGVEKNTW